MKLYVETILDSRLGEVRITTLRITYPRFIHSQLMTHGLLSVNSLSSRAVPMNKVRRNVLFHPAFPVEFGRKNKGMSSKGPLPWFRKFLAKRLWFWSRYPACLVHFLLETVGLAKQVSNRLLEPWSYNVAIVTATEWDNFFSLRIADDADPTIKRLAEMIYDERENTSSAGLVSMSVEHLPFITEHERKVYIATEEFALGTHHKYNDCVSDDTDYLKTPQMIEVAQTALISTARIARVSYNNQLSKFKTITDDISLGIKLIQNRHMSPSEHIAYKPEEDDYPKSNLLGVIQLRKTIPCESITLYKPK